MKTSLPVTKEFFIKRLTDLCLRSGLSGFPTDETAQLILLKSAALCLDRTRTYSEKEINEKLEYWISGITKLKGIDHTTLRRFLVDTGFLGRNAECSSYYVSGTKQHDQLFDNSVNQVNVSEAIENAREEIARRKKEFMEKSGIPKNRDKK